MFRRLPNALIQVLKRNYATPPKNRKIGIMGVPFEDGQAKVGVAHGPAALRGADLLTHIRNIRYIIDEDIDVKDYGDVSYKVTDQVVEVQNMRMYANMAACNLEVSKMAQDIINDGRICIALGGDHSISIGTVDGHLKAKNERVCIIWVDAHADLNTNKTSESGNIHGMPLALLAKELADYWPYLPGMDWQKPLLSIRNVAYIGLRSVDPYERLIIERLGITAFGMEDVENLGIHTVTQMALKRIDPGHQLSIHVSFDIDALDSLEAPSTGTAVRGGLSLRESVHMIEQIYKTGRLAAMDLVEINPAIGSPYDIKKTVDAGIHLIQAACGYSRRGLLPNSANSLPLQTFPPKFTV